MEERKKIAEKIATNPGGYKICEGCASIVVSGTLVCPNCHAYRYIENSQEVVKQALLLGSREQQSVTYEDLS